MKTRGSGDAFASRFRQVAGALPAAFEDASLLGFGPAADDGFSGQMNDRVEAGN